MMNFEVMMKAEPTSSVKGTAFEGRMFLSFGVAKPNSVVKSDSRLDSHGVDGGVAHRQPMLASHGAQGGEQRVTHR